MSEVQEVVARKAPDVGPPSGEYRPPAAARGAPRFSAGQRSFGEDDNCNWRTGARVERNPNFSSSYAANSSSANYGSRGGFRGASSDSYRGGRGSGRMGGGRGGSIYGGAVSGYGSTSSAAFPRGSRRDWGDDRPSGLSRDDGTWATRDGRHPQVEREIEIFKSTKDKTTGINFDSYDAIEVEVSGSNTGSLQPLLSFRTAADMPVELTANILRVRYDKPTPVQKYAIPILLADRDLMACAQTGSGKTAAFLFPIIIKMLKGGPPPAVQSERRVPHPVALVLSPTRELTCQIFEESRKFAFGTGIRTVVVYGGTDTRAQLIDLSKGCDICVATPGRLNDILERAKISLSQVKYLVLDEADRMLDMGFAPQIHQIVETKDMPNSQQGRQTAMFSATFPREIQQLAADFLLNYVYLTVGRVGSTNEFITQKLIYAEEVEKPKRLLQLLKESKGRVLVFVETKKKADVIEDFLVNQGLHATSIHGDRSQVERNRALELFKDGRCSVLVATDVAARGLDIHSITWVINLDLPHNIEDYVHRIGRTGRAGNAGMATSFVNEQNRPILRELHRLLEEANQEVPSWFLDLTRACSNAASRFGPSRYGGRGGGRGNFGGVDYRSLDGGNRSRFNVGTGSPRGGYVNRQNDSGFERGNAGGNYGNRAGAAPRAPQQHEGKDCW